jgi:hypothetical protein
MLGCISIAVNDDSQVTAGRVLALVRGGVYYRGSAAAGGWGRAIISIRLQILSRQPVIPSTGESRANQDH